MLRIKNFFKTIKKGLSPEESAEISGMETTDHLIFNISRPMAERLRAAADLWQKDGRGWNHLLTEEAFFAAQCWVYTNRVYQPDSEQYDPQLLEFTAACRASIGGDSGWESMLAQRTTCAVCGTVWRLENIHFCVVCMRHVCPECRAGHIRLCGDQLVG